MEVIHIFSQGKLPAETFSKCTLKWYAASATRIMLENITNFVTNDYSWTLLTNDGSVYLVLKKGLL